MFAVGGSAAVEADHARKRQFVPYRGVELDRVLPEGTVAVQAVDLPPCTNRTGVTSFDLLRALANACDAKWSCWAGPLIFAAGISFASGLTTLEIGAYNEPAGAWFPCLWDLGLALRKSGIVTGGVSRPVGAWYSSGIAHSF